MNSYSYLDIITNDNKFKLSPKQGLELKKIIEIETRLKINLPNDLINLYLYSNGIEGDDWIFNIIPLTQVENLKDAVGDYLTFAEYMIYSEICGLEIDPDDRNSYKFFVHKYDQNILERKYISNSVPDFLKLYCDLGTLYMFAD